MPKHNKHSREPIEDNMPIIEKLAKNKVVEGLVCKICKLSSIDNDYGDLIQDVYMSLAFDDKLLEINEKEQVNFYLSRIILNNVASSTSPFYRKYKLANKLFDRLNNSLNQITDDD